VRLALRNAQAQAEIELGAEWRVRASPALQQALSALDGVLGAELSYAPTQAS